jgi:hypothetical protein
MRNLPTTKSIWWDRLKLRFNPGNPVAALPWNSALRPLEDFHQNQYTVTTGTGPVECVTTTAVSVRNIMNEYLARLSNQSPKPNLIVDSYVKQLDSMGDQGRIYRNPSNAPSIHIPLVGDISRAGWMHPRTQMLRTLKQFASEFEQYYDCSYTVKQSSRNSYTDIAREVREGNLVIIHLMHEPQAPGQFWIGGNPHTLGPVIRIDAKEITLLDTGTDKTTTYPREEFMKSWGRSSQLRFPPVRWMPEWLQPKLPFYYAYTPPRTMTVITPDTSCSPANMPPSTSMA